MAIRSNVGEVLMDLSRWIEEHERRKWDGVRAVAIQALADIMELSPVDTGRFRASHFLSIGEASGQTAPEAGGFGDAASARIHEATSTLAGMVPAPSVQIFIVNNLPYAWSLENGHSKQAPAGVYAVTAVRAESNIRKLGGNLSP